MDQAIPTRLNLQCELAVETLNSSGELRLRAMGSSMIPSLWPGDVLIIQQLLMGAAEVGEIVLFQREGRFYIHRLERRICGRDGERWVTRGDAVAACDLPVESAEVLGRVVSVERNGAQFKVEPRLSLSRRLVSHLLRRSDLAIRVLLRLHAVLASGPAGPGSSAAPARSARVDATLERA